MAPIADAVLHRAGIDVFGLDCGRRVSLVDDRSQRTIIDALVGLGQLAIDCPDVIESVDINPFAALPNGGMALDALIVLRRS